MQVRGAVALVVASIALGGCASNQATTSDPQTSTRASRELRVQRGDFRKAILLTGELEAVKGYPVIVPRTESWQVTIRWMLDDGSTVEQGDKVLELDTTQVIGDVAQKRIAADTALSELYQKEADIAVEMADKQFAVEAARVAYEKARLRAAVPRELVQRREFQEAELEAERTAVAYQNAVADLDAFREAAEREIEILRINLDKARRDITRAERALETMVLRAPRSGIFVVGEHPWEGRKIQLGDSVWIGLNVAEIPDLSKMMVRAKLSDVDDAKIAPGMRAVCTVDAYPDIPVDGVVRDVGPVAQEDLRASLRRNFKVFVDLDRSDPEIMRPGMSVRVEVEAARRDDVLLVPRAAVGFDGGTPRAYLADGDATEIVLGECNAQVCELLEGLGEGARLRARR